MVDGSVDRRYSRRMTAKQKGGEHYSVPRASRISRRIELTLSPAAFRKLKKIALAEQGNRKKANWSGVVNRLILEAEIPPITPKQ